MAAGCGRLNVAILSTGWLILLFLYRKGAFLKV